MILTRGNLVFDTMTGALHADGMATASPAQGRILAALMESPHGVGRDALIDQITDGSPDSIADATLDVHIFRLRHKLARIGSTAQIVCMWGRGFQMMPPATIGAFVSVPAVLWRQAVALARRHDAALAARLEQVEG
ncbi:MAG: helix-turn-helix domain-containing protein [Gemmatimonadaceae bacterium]